MLLVKDTDSETRCGRTTKAFGGNVLSDIAGLLGVVGYLVQACPCQHCKGHAVWKRLRVTKDAPDVSRRLLREFEKHVVKLKRRYLARCDPKYLANETRTCSQVMREEIADHFPKPKRDMYYKFIDWYEANGWPEDGIKPGFQCKDKYTLLVNVFVKNEAANPDVLFAERGVFARTRAICPTVIAGLEFENGNLGIIALEGRHLLPLVNGKKSFKNPGGEYVFTSGETLRETAGSLVRLGIWVAGRFVWIKLDASSFDGSCHILAPVGRRANLEVLKGAMGHLDSWRALLDLYAAQEDLYLSARGLKARLKGVRMSGTAATSFDNQTMYWSLWTFCVKVVMKWLGNLTRHKITELVGKCAGDDTCAAIFVEWLEPASAEEQAACRKGAVIYGVQYPDGKEPNTLLGWVTCLCSNFGIDVKQEGITDDIMDTVFCRMKIIDIGGGQYVLCKSPGDVYQKLSTVFHPDDNLEVEAAYMASVCMGYLGAWARVPLVGVLAREFGRAWFKASGGRLNDEKFKANHYMFRNETVEEGVSFDMRLEYTEESRLSFARAFGYAPEEQIHIEAMVCSDAFSTALEASIRGEGDAMQFSYIC